MSVKFWKSTRNPAQKKTGTKVRAVRSRDAMSSHEKYESRREKFSRACFSGGKVHETITTQKVFA